MARIASLPWYDHAQTRHHLDALWRFVVDLLPDEDLPLQLDRTTPLFDQWRDDRLVVSQCCGLDLFTEAGAKLVPFARPSFRTIEAPAGMYFSHVVARPNDPSRARVAINARSSRSGYTGLLGSLKQRNPEFVVTRSHAASLRAVRDGYADVAAIDAHTWSFLDVEGVEVVSRTSLMPSPPFVTNQPTLVPALRRALGAAIERTPAVGIAGLLDADRDTYAPVLKEARAVGWTDPVASPSPRSVRS